MSIHYFAELPQDQTLLLDGKMMVTDYVFGQLAEYSTTTPTAPSLGRIYRRNLAWPDKPTKDDWRVFVCEEDPEPGWVAHRPFQLVIATLPEIRDARIRTWLAEAIP